eukprot:1262762-Rhodomonas_salina.1
MPGPCRCASRRGCQGAGPLERLRNTCARAQHALASSSFAARVRELRLGVQERSFIQELERM